MCRKRSSVRLRYPVYIGNNRPSLVEREPNNFEQMDRDQQQHALVPQAAEPRADEPIGMMDIAQEIEIPFEIDKAEQSMADQPQVDIAAAGESIEMVEVAQEVEVPFEIDPAVQLSEDWNMAKDLEMAELLLFEMNYDEAKVQMEPKPKRNKRCPEAFSNVDLVCVRCGKKIRRNNLPVEAANEFVCSEKCMNGV